VTRLSLDRFDTPQAEVHERFRAAIRSGRPSWLWPEVPRDGWREALGRIQRALTAMLMRGTAELAGTGDPQALALACYTSGTGPLLGWWHDRAQLRAKPDEAEIIALHLHHNRRRMETLATATKDIGGALSRQGIKLAILKGMHTAADYFPDPATRPAADIDLLISPNDRPAAESILQAEGFACTTRGRFESSWCHRADRRGPRSLWLAHADDDWSVDLHHSLNIPLGRGIGVAKLDAASPMASAHGWRGNPRIGALSQPLLLLHLAVHAGASLQNLTMLRLVELHLVIRRDLAAGALSWDAFLAMAEQTRTLGYCYPALQMCEKLVPESIPEAVLDATRRHAPPSLPSFLAGLEPATVQRVDRSSVAEHFMWTTGWRDRLRQLSGDLLASFSPLGLWSIYERRAWQLMRGTITRG
jgi:hypothetical protein